MKKKIESPSPEFQQFVEEYFLSRWRWRLEQDTSVLDKLHGIERDVATELICANLRTAEIQIIDAAARLKVEAAIPILRAMLSKQRGAWEAFAIAKALYSLNHLDIAGVFSVAERALRKCGGIDAHFILAYVDELFSPDEAQKLIDIALRRDSYDIRAAAYRAAVAVQYIRAHGGVYTEDVGREIRRKDCASATVGSEQPMFYEQLQYYVGNQTYRNRPQFEQRLAELWAADPKARRVPLFTEINRER